MQIRRISSCCGPLGIEVALTVQMKSHEVITVKFVEVPNFYKILKGRTKKKLLNFSLSFVKKIVSEVSVIRLCT